MREVNNLLHFTRELDTVKKVLKNGFKASYAVESLGKRKILLPMVSFSNLLFRDVGEDEVVDYGQYGIGINREYAVKSGINPVIYLYENSQIDNAINSLLNLTIIPQGLDKLQKITQVKNFTKITDYVKFNPIPDEVKEIVDSIDGSTSDNLVLAITKYAKKAHENVYH
ncbi:MAG: abortive infection system antitoxin AbiGi family protein [Bacteroidota bacterium]|nr:abortive infection system antitoxin AbiGi family protein [Bacteroidota bacterium]